MIEINNIRILYPAGAWPEALARHLEKELVSYRIPRAVSRKTGIRSLTEVPEPWLIVLCTPDLKNDTEVLQEIADFSKKGLFLHILTMLASGRSGDGFPEVLVKEELPDGTIREHEPLAANVSAKSEKESLKKLKTEKLRLIAPILGVAFDDLMDRRSRQRRRIALIAGGAVLAAASAFLCYALFRVMEISRQNRTIQENYVKAEKARAEAVTQKNAAREELAGTVGIFARQALEDRDCELALLLCLEFLPDHGNSTDLPEILKETLNTMCRTGYVPVTSKASYERTRRLADQEKEAAEKAADDVWTPDHKIWAVVEEDMNGREGYGMDYLMLQDRSLDYGYAVYSGGFYTKDPGSDLLVTLIRFRDDPGKDHYLRDEDGNYAYMDDVKILPDGTMIGIASDHRKNECRRYDPFRKEYLLFSEDGGPGIKDILGFETVPYIFGAVKGEGMRVYSREPFRYLYTIPEVLEFQELEGTGYLYGETEHSLMVYRKESYEYLYTIEDGNHFDYPNYEAFHYPDGSEYLVHHANDSGGPKLVYDLSTGEQIAEIGEGLRYNYECSADRKLLCSKLKTPMIWNMEDGKLFAEIPGGNATDPKPCGAFDPVSGLRDSEAVLCGNVVYEYRQEAKAVPEDPEAQLRLAKELLGDRVLTARERKMYYLSGSPDFRDVISIPAVVE